MGRAPCCDKTNVKKGPWSPEEDAKLKAYIEQNGTGGNWIALPQKIGLKRCGKSCRLRWLNYLRPNIKHGGFSEEEDNIICSLYISIGSRWSIIAAQLPGRTDNDIKNYWNTRLKKKLIGKQRKEQAARRACSCAVLKQEMKRESDDQYTLVVPPASGLMNQQTPYWPELLPFDTPLVNPQHFNDQASLRDLLMIKLGGGGRFCDADDHHQQQQQQSIITTTTYPIDVSFSQDQLYGGATPNFPVELTEFTYDTNNHRQLEDELERLYGMNASNGSTGTSSTSAENTIWEDMSSLVYSTMVSDYETSQQNMPEDSTSIEELSTNFGYK